MTSTLVIGEAAAAAGLNVVSSEIHGMSQRGGIVETTVLVGDVHGPMVPDGGADVLIAFEPVEAVRFLRKSTPERTVVLLNTRPVIPIWVSLGKERYPDWEEIRAAVEARSRRLHAFDATGLALEAGTARAVGAVMLGALAGLDLLPISLDTWKETLLARVPRKYREVNERAFQAGLEQVARRGKK